MHYTGLVAATLLSLSAYPLSAQAAASCDAQLKVGAWNIEWLGSAVRANPGHQAPEDIASYIAAAKVDVLAMSEISATRSGDGDAGNRQLDEAFALLNAQGAAWQYKLFEKHPQAGSPNDQWTGLAWNGQQVQLAGGPWNVAAVDEQRRVELLGAESKKVPLNRTPYAVKLTAGQGKSDFLFVPLHLKANSGKDTDKQRELEIHLILKGLERVRTDQGEDDVVLLGDTNMLSTAEPGVQLLRDRGMRDCNQADQNTWLSTRERLTDAPFDRIFVMRDQPETRQTCASPGDPSMAFEVVAPGDWIAGMNKEQFRQRLSDHQMVRTTLCIGADDD